MIAVLGDYQPESFLVDVLGSHSGCLAVIRVADYKGSLIGKENSLIASKARTYARAFSSGRHCVRMLQQYLNLPEVEIGSTAAGPNWQKGSKGSISHSACLAAAILVSADTISGIGLDIELKGRVKTRHLERIGTARERLNYGSLANLDPTLLFSAKESAFKALNPISQKYMGFQDLELSFDFEGQTFAMNYLGHDTDNTIIQRANGYWTEVENHFLTLVVIDS